MTEDNKSQPWYERFQIETEFDENYVRTTWPHLTDSEIEGMRKSFDRYVAEGWLAVKTVNMDGVANPKATGYREKVNVPAPFGIRYGGYTFKDKAGVDTLYPEYSLADEYTLELYVYEELGICYTQDNTEFAGWLNKGTEGYYVEDEWVVAHPKLNEMQTKLIDAVMDLTYRTLKEEDDD